MTQNYTSLLGFQQGAKRLHVHVTEIADTRGLDSYEHVHEAEEAVYILEGRAEYAFADTTVVAGPGEVVFIPSQVRHAKIRYLTPSIKYLVIRNVCDADAPCCCGCDKG